ncbi:MAG: hypothetical protein CMB31_04845 [Euryarchaeota archaeon]|nr:hypothetical protein [Euryarchaeota archaeon]
MDRSLPLVRTGILIPILLLASLTPLVVADPPPGTSEVTNTICDEIPGTGIAYSPSHSTICDDWTWSDDDTPGSNWVVSEYAIEMDSLTQMSLDMEFAIYEFNRTLLNLEDLDLGGNSTDDDGIPADYIRNYFQLPTPSGSDVKETLRTEMGEIVEDTLASAFGSSTGVSVNYVSSIGVAGAPIVCSDDPGGDSADEDAAVSENAYYPPVCLRVIITVNVDPSTFGLPTASGGEMERLFRGLLTMGGTASTEFSLLAEEGHLVSYDISPPPYANFEIIDDFGTPVSRTENLYSYTSGIWILDNTGASSGDGTIYDDAEIKISRRNTSTRSVEFSSTDTSMDIQMTVDARDEANSVVTLGIDLNYLDTSLLDTWGIQPFNEGVDLPWITSDGIRMLQEFGYVDLQQLTGMLPLTDVANSFAEQTGSSVSFSEVSFTPPSDSGGLDFTHTALVTCAEISPTGFCVEGANAMNGTYPIMLESNSTPINLDVIDLAVRLINETDENGDPLDVSFIEKNDLAKILNVLSVSKEVNPDILSNYIPDSFPSTDITLTILLPTWARSTGDVPDRLELVYRHQGSNPENLGLTGPVPWDWEHALCYETVNCLDTSPDVFCKSDWATCIKVEVDVDLSGLRILEFSGAIEADIEASVELHVHRIGVPIQANEFDMLTFESIPSDLIRHVIAIGDRRDGGLIAGLGFNTDIPIGDSNHTLEISNSGFQNFSVAISDEIARTIEETNIEIQEMVDEASGDLQDQIEAQDLPAEFNGIKIDLSGIRLIAEIGELTEVTGNELSDEEPIVIGASLEKMTVRLGINSNQELAFVTSPAQVTARIAESLASSFFDSSAANSGMRGFTAPLIEEEIPAVGDDVEGMLVSPSIKIELGFPRGLGVSEFSSSNGNAEVELIDGRQHLTYILPLCDSDPCEETTDRVSLGFVLGYEFILIELMPYLTVILALITLIIFRRSSKRARKKKKLADEKKRAKLAQQQNTAEVLLDDMNLPPPGVDWESAGGWGEDPWEDPYVDPAEVFMQGRKRR